MTESRRRELNARLHAIAEAHGGSLSTDHVIDDARDPTSPLHTHFEWDDARAAHAHRTTTAARLINGFRVTVEVNSVALSAPAFIRSVEQPRLYIPIDRAAAEADLARATLRREGARVAAAITRMRAVAMALGLTEQLEELDRTARSILHAIE